MKRILLGALLAPALAAGQARGVTARFAAVTYLTTTTAYLNAGRADGLRDSVRLEVFRNGQRVGAIRVAFLASHQASCDIVDTVRALAIGDSARYVPAAGPAVTTAAAPVGWSAASRPAPPLLTGTVGFEYFSVSGDGVHLSQPGVDLRLFAGPPGSQWGGVLDLRERRATTAAPGTSTSAVTESRVYQAFMRWRPGGASLRVEMGRQFVEGLSSVGLVDGLQIVRETPTWAVGGFVGTQPGLADLEVSSDIRMVGAFVRRQGQPAGGGAWSLTAGASGSYQIWRTNREFMYFEARYFSSRFSGYLSQEVDYYRPWKRVGGESAFSPTATFGQLRFEFTPGLAIEGGVDERRNVRLFEDVVSPESTFDAAFRRGAWIGTSLRPGEHVWVELDARASDGGTIGRTDSYTASVSLVRLGALGASARTRATYYLSPGRVGRLAAMTVGVAPADRWRVSVDLGQRDETVAILSSPQVSRWVGLSLDVSLARAWFMTFSATRQRGAQQNADQLFAYLSYRL